MVQDAVADRNLALEAVRVTEAAALAAVRFLGGGDERAADEAAVAAMHDRLKHLAIDGTVRVGEGSEGEVAHLYIGEKVGTGGGPKVDVAALALEGKSIVARGGPNALAVIAMAEDGGFLNVPEIYMDKIAVGPGVPADAIDIGRPVAENLAALADAKGTQVENLVVCMLDRPRHSQKIGEIREAGARIRLILDGDVSGVLAAALPEAGVDMFLGIGGAPQGVLAAAALRGLGGHMQGRLFFRTDDDRAAAEKVGINDPDTVYGTTELARGNVTFAATGVTYSPLLQGVRLRDSGAVSHSVVVRSKTSTLRFIETHHSQVP
jgi:fructose-1,6-bisphosphatase II / sedoheptulose-1,7-bisphosphatase